MEVAEKGSKKALGIIFLIVFMDLVGFGMIIPLSSYLSKSFQVSAFENGMLMAIYSLMQFLFSPFWGKISDKIGRRPILLMSLLGSTFSYLGYAYSTEYWMLFTCRAFAGLFAANISTAMAYIADITTTENRSKGMGLIGAAFGLGFVLGPMIGGLLGHYGPMISEAPPFGINFSALIASVICFINFLLAVKILKESLPAEKRKNLAERKSRVDRLVHNFKRPVIGRLLLVTLFSGLGMAHMESTIFYYVMEKFNWGLRFASLGFAYIGVIMVFTQGYLIRKVMPKFGERKLLVFGLSMVAIGMFVIPFSTGVISMAIAQTLLALGLGLSNPSLNGSVSLSGDSNEQGELLGVNQSMAAMGRILGPALGGFFYGSIGKDSPYFFAGALMLAGLFVTITIYSKLPEGGKSH